MLLANSVAYSGFSILSNILFAWSPCVGSFPEQLKRTPDVHPRKVIAYRFFVRELALAPEQARNFGSR